MLAMQNASLGLQCCVCQGTRDLHLKTHILLPRSFPFFNQLCLTSNFKVFQMLPVDEKGKRMLSDSIGKFSCKEKSFLF